jgi:WhiB family redox-sensing transcriptional regulator
MTRRVDPTPRARFVMPADDSWRDDAACRGEDTDMFFPAPSDVVTAAKAVAVCDTCPVSDACLRDALETGEQHGIRGGLAPHRRRQLRADQRRGVTRQRREYAPKRSSRGHVDAAPGRAITALWDRITSEVDLTGSRPTVREIAAQLGVSSSYAHRAIAAHRDTWDQLTSADRHRRADAEMTL